MDSSRDRHSIDPLWIKAHDQLVDPTNAILDSTVAFLLPNARGAPECIGSGVVLAVGDDRFLVTAAHVIARAGARGLHVSGAESIVSLPGKHYTTRHTGGRDDRFDLAVIPLLPEPLKQLGQLRVVPMDELHPGERRDRRPVVRSKYLLVGYPSSRQPRQPTDGVFALHGYQALTHESDNPDYAKYNVAEDTHLTLAFDRSEFLGPYGAQLAPDPHGMSGCGVWLLDGFMAGGTPRPLLVAIAIEYYERDGVLLATRVGTALDGIAAHNPALRSHVYQPMQGIAPPAT